MAKRITSLSQKKDNILYLTIKPFYEFQPIINQPFTLAQQTVLKYVNITEPVQVNNTNSQRLIPGERIMVEPQNIKKGLTLSLLQRRKLHQKN